MAAISRAQILKELLPGLNALFGLTYNQYGDQHKEIFQIETSKRSFEEEQKLVGLGQANVKLEGEAIDYDSGSEAYTSRYVHETIAKGFSITEEAMEDNLYESMSARYTKALARSMAYTKQVKAAAILNNAFNGASYAGGDGVSLCGFSDNGVTNTGHSLYGGGINKNALATAADLNETALEAATIAISKWTDERGLLIAAKPRKLVVPPDLQFVASKVLNTELTTAINRSPALTFAPNDINAIKNNGTIPEGYTVNNYLTDVNGWFILTDIPDSLKMFVRVPLATAMDGDFDTGNVRYKARERYSFGWSDHLGIFGSPGV